MTEILTFFQNNLIDQGEGLLDGEVAGTGHAEAVAILRPDEGNGTFRSAAQYVCPLRRL